MSEQHEPIKFAELPEIVCLSQSEEKRAMDLLIELDELTTELSWMEDRAKEVKIALYDIQKENELTGLKHREFCFFGREVAGRQTLDKTMLIENGVTPEQIKQSMKTGKSYIEHRFKKVEEVKVDKKEKPRRADG